MGSINISIKKEAYDFLKSLKSKDKSFSEVILEFKGRKGNDGSILLDFAGGLKGLDVDWDKKEKRMKEFRESFNKRVEDTVKYMKEARECVRKRE